jgi:endonuclease III
MKNSREYSQRVRKLYRSLKSKHAKPQPAVYEEPVDALVCGILSERISETGARSAIKRFVDHFIDWNDLRVSRIEEIVELLRGDTAVARDVAGTLMRALKGVFEKYNMVSLKALKKTGKKPARQILEKIEGVSTFVTDYCMLTSLQGHAIPLTRTMLDYLRSNELVHPDAEDKEIEGFLARQISADNAYEFYVLLRSESESPGAFTAPKTRRRVKTKTAGETKKKATRTRKLKK